MKKRSHGLPPLAILEYMRAYYRFDVPMRYAVACLSKPAICPVSFWERSWTKLWARDIFKQRQKDSPDEKLRPLATRKRQVVDSLAIDFHSKKYNALYENNKKIGTPAMRVVAPCPEVGSYDNCPFNQRLSKPRWFKTSSLGSHLRLVSFENKMVWYITT